MAMSFTVIKPHHYGPLHEQLSLCADKWERIAIGLRFTSDEIRNIKCSPLNIVDGPMACLGAVLSDWMQWAPGDARGSTESATLEALKTAVSKAGFGVTANELTLTDDNVKKKNSTQNSAVSKSFPYLKLQDLSQEDKDELVTRLELESTRIRRKFAGLVRKTAKAMEARTTPDDIKYYLNDCGLDDLADQIQHQDTVSSVLHKIGERKLWSFFDYELLEDLADTFCKDGTVAGCITEYKLCFKEYCERRLDEVPLGCFNMVAHNIHPKSKICMKIDKRFDGNYPLHEEGMRTSLITIKELQVKLSELLGIKHLVLLSVELGCIKVVLRHFNNSNPLCSISIADQVVLALLGVKKIHCDVESYDLQPYLCQKKASDMDSLPRKSQIEEVTKWLKDCLRPIDDDPLLSDWRKEKLQEGVNLFNEFISLLIAEETLVSQKPNCSSLPTSTTTKPTLLPSEQSGKQCNTIGTSKTGPSKLSKNKKAPKKTMGVVVTDFNGLYPDELSIKVGEEIEIISKDTIVSRNIGWWTGRKGKGKFGIFPAACVSCDMQQQSAGTESLANSDYPLEIKNSEIDMKEVIGIGGFGKVYRAIYKGEDVAVKVAKTTTFDSLKAVQDVVSEAEKLVHLAHTNICALVGVVLVKDVCLVMEYAQGGALSEILHKSNISLSIDVITSWTSQIASGMHYLHHEAEPSLIHRDLKTSHILLANPLEPDILKGNIIKITDFGLAHEIEHTTHMSGAGIYPYMAPEVIRTSDFSKKSDVWSFAVVVWELLTGERPYNGLNLFVVAYGVGHGTLTLPVPDDCPKPFARLMNGCWKREHTERPSFKQIVSDMRNLEGSGFCTSMTHEEFGTMQNTWRGEMQKKFVELKNLEHELEKREQQLGKKVKELAEEKLRIDKRAEEVRKLLEQVKLAQEQSKRESASMDGPSGPFGRPPRIRCFKLRKYFQEPWESAKTGNRPKVDNPLPNKMDNVRTFRRITSSSTPSGGVSMEEKLSGGASAPQWVKGHKRQSSDEVTGASSLCIGNTPDAYRRESVPSSLSQHRAGGGVDPSSYQPVIVQHPHKWPTTSSSLRRKRTSLKMWGRQRSYSDLRSTSPQQELLLPSLSPPKAGSSPPSPPLATKPAFLGLHKLTYAPKASSSESLGVMVTTADHPPSQYDSGKDSMTSSDALGHSDFNETTHPDMIEFDLPNDNAGIDFFAREFDPLRPGISHDSLLFDSKLTPANASESTSPNTSSLTTPISSLTTPTSVTATSPMPTWHDSACSMHPSRSIARKRPKPSDQYSLNTISAPHPSPYGAQSLPAASGDTHSSSKGTVSPTRSIQSLIYDWDSYEDALTLDSASDMSSTSSSLRDLSIARELDEEEEDPTMREISILLGFLNSKYS